MHHLFCCDLNYSKADMPCLHCLCKFLEQTTDDLKDAYNNLGNVVEPDLIDYYIYQVKAVSMRYKFLLDCVKKIEDPYAKNPL